MGKDYRHVPDADEQFEEMKEKLVSRRVAAAGGAPKDKKPSKDADSDWD